MKKFILIVAIYFGLCPAGFGQTVNRGRDFLLPADFNFPARIYMWEVTGDDPFISEKDEFRIGLSYNYSSAEKYFDEDGGQFMVKESFRQFNKGSDPGGYFRKHGAILNAQYHFEKFNKLVARFPFTFTEINSYSSTTDVKPQPEWIKPRGPFQDVEFSYTRKFLITSDISFYGGAGLSLPTSRPKRYFDPPHGGNGNRFTNNINAYFSYNASQLRFTTGGKYIIKYPLQEELFTPRPYGIGYPFLYDTTSISADEMNTFIEANPYEAQVKMGTQLIFDLVVDYFTKIGFSSSVHFQYFNSSGEEYDREIPVAFARVNGNITPVGSIQRISGGSQGILRLYLKQDFEKLSKSRFSFVLGYGTSVFGKNSPQEANLILGITGSF